MSPKLPASYTAVGRRVDVGRTNVPLTSDSFLVTFDFVGFRRIIIVYSWSASMSAAGVECGGWV